MGGQRYDAAGQCVERSSALVACFWSEQTVVGVTDDEKCRVDESTGEIYLFGGLAPNKPEILDFRDCTGAERSTALRAPSCGQ